MISDHLWGIAGTRSWAHGGGKGEASIYVFNHNSLTEVSDPIGFSLHIKEWGRGNTQQTVTGQTERRPNDRKGCPDHSTVKSNFLKPEHSETNQSCFFVAFFGLADLR